MKNQLLGQFSCDVLKNGIFLPDKFQMEEKTATLLLFHEEPWYSIQLWENLDDETLDLLSHDYKIVEKQKVLTDKNGYFHLPQSFLSQLKDGDPVIVSGIGNCIEILSFGEFEEMSHGLEMLEEQFDFLWES